MFQSGLNALLKTYQTTRIKATIRMSLGKRPLLTKAQRRVLFWAKRRYHDGRVPPYVFRDYRSADKLLKEGLIEFWIGYGAPMYKFTQRGLDVLEQIDSPQARREEKS